MAVLGPTYRFVVLNSTTQTIATNSLFVKTKRYNRNSSNTLVYEGSEATVLSSGSTLANATYLAGTTQDNTSLKWEGGDFTFTVTAPASSNGNVTLFFGVSTDGGTTWDTNGVGQIVATLNFTTSGTKSKTFRL